MCHLPASAPWHSNRREIGGQLQKMVEMLTTEMVVGGCERGAIMGITGQLQKTVELLKVTEINVLGV